MINHAKRKHQSFARMISIMDAKCKVLRVKHESIDPFIEKIEQCESEIKTLREKLENLENSEDQEKKKLKKGFEKLEKRLIALKGELRDASGPFETKLLTLMKAEDIQTWVGHGGGSFQGDMAYKFIYSYLLLMLQFRRDMPFFTSLPT